MDPDFTESERRPSPFRRWAYVLIGIILGATFLYLAARNIDLNEAMAAIYAINKPWVIPFTIIWLLNILLRSLRWQYMFPDDSRPSLRHALDAFVLGKVGNNFMPGRLGEVVRASVIGKFYPRVGLSGSLATVVVEKILDSFVILLMLGIALLSAPLPDWITHAGMWLIVFFSILLLVLWFISRAQDPDALEAEDSATDSALAKLKGLVLRLVRKFSTGLHTLRAAHHFTLSGILTLVIWAGEAAMMFTLIMAFSISAPVMAAVVSVVFLCIGGMLPNAPGFVGTYQLFIVAALQLYGVPETDAFALSIFMNLYVIILTSVLGVLVFVADGGIVNVRQVIAASARKA
jgi:uncharacterized protein (TIRG00374 family)